MLSTVGESGEGDVLIAAVESVVGTQVRVNRERKSGAGETLPQTKGKPSVELNLLFKTIIPF